MPRWSAPPVKRRAYLRFGTRHIAESLNAYLVAIIGNVACFSPLGPEATGESAESFEFESSTSQTFAIIAEDRQSDVALSTSLMSPGRTSIPTRTCRRPPVARLRRWSSLSNINSTLSSRVRRRHRSVRRRSDGSVLLTIAANFSENAAFQLRRDNRLNTRFRDPPATGNIAEAEHQRQSRPKPNTN